MSCKKLTLAFALLNLLASCIKKTEIDPNDKKAVLDEIWNTVDQRYCLFADKNVSWDSVYSIYSNQVNETTTDPQLFKTCVRMLDHLMDGHVVLFSPFDTVGYDGYYSLYARNFNFSNVKKNYLNNIFSTDGPLTYKQSDGIGYIHVASFAQNIPEATWDRIFSEFSGIKGLIIDVRDNQGGSTSLAASLSSRFYTEEKLSKYEVIKTGPGSNDFSDPQPFIITPYPKGVRTPVVVLTNRACFSACNDFVLYMTSLVNVTQIGDQTGGGGGIPNQFILRNGWKIQYSSSRTLSPSSQSIESGLLPDIKASITPIQEQAGIDPILDAAITLLK